MKYVFSKIKSTTSHVIDLMKLFSWPHLFDLLSEFVALWNLQKRCNQYQKSLIEIFNWT